MQWYNRPQRKLILKPRKTLILSKYTLISIHICYSIFKKYYTQSYSGAVKYHKRRFIVRYCKVSQQRNMSLWFSNSSDIWQASRQCCCCAVSQLSKRYKKLTPKLPGVLRFARSCDKRYKRKVKRAPAGVDYLMFWLTYLATGILRHRGVTTV